MQILTNRARAILADSSLNLNFWPEAVKYFVYVWNQVCPKSLKKTPCELYGGLKPSVKDLKSYDSIVFVGIPKQRRQGKLGPRARRGILVGYAFRTRGYHIWIPEINPIVESIDITFDKKTKYDPESSGAVMGQNLEIDGLFPMGIVNQNERVVEVAPEGISGPSNISPDSRSGGGRNIDHDSEDDD